ncbi:hypothetical protein GCM10028862_02800 [Luteimonas pelagia]
MHAPEPRTLAVLSLATGLAVTGLQAIAADGATQAAPDAAPVATDTAAAPATLRHDDPALAWSDCPEFFPDGCAIAVLHGDPAAPNADLFFKVPGGSEIASHWHTSAERMVLVSGQLEVRYDDADPVVLRPGSYAYGPARVPHSGACAAGPDCVLFIAFEAPVDAVPVDAAGE